MLDTLPEVMGASCAFVGILSLIMGRSGLDSPEERDRVLATGGADVIRRMRIDQARAYAMMAVGVVGAGIGFWLM